MKLTKIIELTQARVVTGKTDVDFELEKAFSSDLLSDVLTLDEEGILLISGLANVQLIRTAEMADIHVVLLARNKKASADMIHLARENHLILLETPFSIFRASGILYCEGMKSVY